MCLDLLEGTPSEICERLMRLSTLGMKGLSLADSMDVLAKREVFVAAVSFGTGEYNEYLAELVKQINELVPNIRKIFLQEEIANYTDLPSSEFSRLVAPSEDYFDTKQASEQAVQGVLSHYDETDYENLLNQRKRPLIIGLAHPHHAPRFHYLLQAQGVDTFFPDLVKAWWPTDTLQPWTKDVDEWLKHEVEAIWKEVYSAPRPRSDTPPKLHKQVPTRQLGPPDARYL